MRQKVGFFAGPLLGCLLWHFPVPSLSSQAHHLAAVLVFVIVYWICEPIPIPMTGLLGVALAVIGGITSAERALASFGDPIIFLFIGSFLIAKAMQTNGVDRRIAYRLLAHPWIGENPYLTLAAFGVVAWLVAMWMSVSACTAMLFPVALAIGNASPQSPGFTKALLLFLTYAASAGALSTPIGTPPNLIGIEFIRDRLGISIGFLQWMMFGVPIALVMLVSRFALVIALFRGSMKKSPGQSVAMRKLYEELGPRTPGQRNTLIVFGIAILLWIAPGACGLLLGKSHSMTQAAVTRLSPSVVALLMASILFMLPVNWRKYEFTLSWEKALEIDWGIILLFGSGLALGNLMLDTGLAEVVGHRILGSSTGSPALLMAVAIIVTVIISESASNTAAANMVIPVMLSIVPNNPRLAMAVVLATTFGASIGFILPVSTPANAIVYGSGKLTMRDMAKTGILVDLIGIVIVWLFSIWIAPRLSF